MSFKETRELSNQRKFPEVCKPITYAAIVIALLIVVTGDFNFLSFMRGAKQEMVRLGTYATYVFSLKFVQCFFTDNIIVSSRLDFI